MLGEPIPATSLPKIIGSSWTRTQDEFEQEEGEDSPPETFVKDTPQMQRLRASAFKSLCEHDESLKKLLDEKVINPRKPPDRERQPEGHARSQDHPTGVAPRQ